MSHERTDRAKQKLSRTIRWAVLALVLVVSTGMALAHQLIAGSGRPVPIDSLCPFGGLETIWSVISGAGFIEKTAASAIVLLVATLVVAVFMRRSFCGQICPLGTLQGVFGSLGGRFFRRRPEVPRSIDRFARYLKYVVLAVFTVWTWQAAELVMRPYDPWAAYAHLTSSDLLETMAVGLGVLVVSFAGSLVYERFFCKYLCPTGALLGLLSKVSFLKIARDENACTNCKACDRACPMNIEVSTAQAVTSAECISCNECVNACPAKGALEVTAPGRRTVSPVMVTGIVVAILVAAIGVSTAAGTFRWRMPSLGEAVEEQKTEAGAEAPFDTTLIKGYMSMKEIAKVSGVPEEEFTKKWGVPESDLGKPMKEIKEQYDFEPDDVKAWVAEMLAK